MQKKRISPWTLVQKKQSNNWAFTGALIALLCACLGMVFGWWSSTGYYLEWGGRPTNAMDEARNADTSNFDNVLKF